MALIHLALLLFIAPCALSICPSSPTWRTPGPHYITLASGRTALLWVPARYDGFSALPLVLNFHGANSSPAGQQGYSKFSVKADAETFFVLYPAGLNGTWNAGGCCGTAGNIQTDDIGYMKQLLDEVTKNMICVNPGRIYSTGHSNGAYMTYRMACNETGYSLAAIGPVAGVSGNFGPHSYPCNVGRPLPLIDFHGTSDPLVDYKYVNGTLQYWANKNGCNWNSQTTTYVNGSELCYSLACPNPANNNITMCTRFGGQHGWPGAPNEPNQDIKATDAIWDFFKRFGTGATPPTPAPTLPPSGGCPLGKSLCGGSCVHLSIYDCPSGVPILKQTLNTDYPGSDLPNQPILLPAGSTSADCAEHCATTTGCALWSVSNPGCENPVKCWLKSAIPSTHYGNNCRTVGIPSCPSGTSSCPGVGCYYPSIATCNTATHTLTLKADIGIDRAGQDLARYAVSASGPIKNYVDCATLCAQNDECHGWAMTKAECTGETPYCWLKKSGTITPTNNSCRVSAAL
eukprot:Phypoly_transcript_04527.p1 GENE.Phypoly_transcript_04527~~Phypoly_transcript_04527.p1  ORF type:complete len:515 (+),score=57.17 Phypoly_transcript_04527:583-2127(+)